MNTPLRLAALAVILSCFVTTALHAQVPQVLNYQGRVAVGGVNFNGSGQFAFALVDTTGANTYWSNDGTSVAGSQPSTAVTLPVTNGLYALLPGRHHHRKHDRGPLQRLCQPRTCGCASGSTMA